MTSEAELIRLFIEAQRSGSCEIDATTLGDLDRAAAYRVLAETKMGLGEATGMLKTAIHPDEVGVAAPIYASRVGRSGRYSLPADRVIGLEVEVGLVLARNVPNDPQIDEAGVMQAIDHYFVGVEVIGSRYADRSKANSVGGLADNMSAFGYVIGPNLASGTEVNGLPITIEHAGQQLYSGAAKHAFGTVLASLVAYARAQQPTMPLSPGTAITTGSLCGLVACSGTGHVVARLGDDTVELDLV